MGSPEEESKPGCSPVPGRGAGAGLVTALGGLSPQTNAGPSPQTREGRQRGRRPASPNPRLCGHPCPSPQLHSPSPVPGWTPASCSSSGASNQDCTPLGLMGRPSIPLSVRPKFRPQCLGCLRWARGGGFLPSLLPLLGAPSSQRTGPTGLGAESAGLGGLAPPGRGLRRSTGC